MAIWIPIFLLLFSTFPCSRPQNNAKPAHQTAPDTKEAKPEETKPPAKPEPERLDPSTATGEEKQNREKPETEIFKNSNQYPICNATDRPEILDPNPTCKILPKDTPSSWTKTIAIAASALVFLSWKSMRWFSKPTPQKKKPESREDLAPGGGFGGGLGGGFGSSGGLVPLRGRHTTGNDLASMLEAETFPDNLTPLQQQVFTHLETLQEEPDIQTWLNQDGPEQRRRRLGMLLRYAEHPDLIGHGQEIQEIAEIFKEFLKRLEQESQRTAATAAPAPESTSAQPTPRTERRNKSEESIEQARYFLDNPEIALETYPTIIPSLNILQTWLDEVANQPAEREARLANLLQGKQEDPVVEEAFDALLNSIASDPRPLRDRLLDIIRNLSERIANETITRDAWEKTFDRMNRLLRKHFKGSKIIFNRKPGDLGKIPTYTVESPNPDSNIGQALQRLQAYLQTHAQTNAKKR